MPIQLHAIRIENIVQVAGQCHHRSCELRGTLVAIQNLDVASHTVLHSASQREAVSTLGYASRG